MNLFDEISGSLQGPDTEKKHFVKIVKSLATVLCKMTLCLCIYFAFTKSPTGREKCSNSEFFLLRVFLYSDLTPSLDTFDAVPLF